MGIKVFLICNGQSVVDEEGERLGLSRYNAPLSNEGESQAKEGAKQLQKYLIENEVGLAGLRVWTSPIVSDIQTMDIFKKIIGLDIVGDVREDIRLAYRSPKIFHTRGECDFKHLFVRTSRNIWDYEKYHDGEFWVKPPMGDALFDVTVRVKSFFDTIWRDFDKEHIDTLFVFAHDAVIHAFSMQWLNTPLALWENTFTSPIPNCTIQLLGDDNDSSYVFKPDWR